MEKLISVIIPAYNAQETIERAINSVDLKKCELIVVIDGATDKTLEICQKIDNIKIIMQENQGQAKARINGVKEATGKYIMFLDADDYYNPEVIDKLEEVITRYKQPDLIRFRYKRDYEQYKYFDKEKYLRRKDFRKNVYPMFIEGYMLNAVWTNCVKKEVLDRCKIEGNTIKYGEDLLMNLEIFSNINNVVFINDILYNYVYMQNSITNNRNSKKILRNLEDAIYVYTKLFEYLKLWKMDTLKNIKLVENRVKKESDALIKILNRAD